MASPFPGMNPYLEQEDAWHDFHERAILLTADLLGAQVLPRYFVKIDEHVYVHELGEESRHFVGRADPAMTRGPTSHDSTTASSLWEAPAFVWQPSMDVERHSYLEIRDRHNRQVNHERAMPLYTPDKDQMRLRQGTAACLGDSVGLQRTSREDFRTDAIRDYDGQQRTEA